MRRRFVRRMDRRVRRMLGGGIPPLLLRSNELLASGNFAEAADGLEQLARGAEGGGGRRAAQLYLAAGRARILADQTAAGMTLLLHGLGILASAGASMHLALASRRIVAELTHKGLRSEAEQIRASVAGLGAASLDGAEPGHAPAVREVLPTHCPGCGAPVHPDEVEWLDEVTAECGYCGTPMRPE